MRYPTVEELPLSRDGKGGDVSPESDDGLKLSPSRGSLQKSGQSQSHCTENFKGSPADVVRRRPYAPFCDWFCSGPSIWNVAQKDRSSVRQECEYPSVCGRLGVVVSSSIESM